MIEIDIENLRNDLVNYFGTAMTNSLPMAVIDLNRVMSASSEELIKIAKANGFNINNYIISIEEVNDDENKKYRLF